MSLTILMFKNTPWENWDHGKDLDELVTLIDVLDGRQLKGDVVHGNFEIQKVSTGEKQAETQYGYVVTMRDHQFHTNDLYMVLYGVGTPGNPIVAETARAVRATINTDAIDGYMIKDTCILRFNGGADAVRDAQAAFCRATDIRVVH
jgi:hypothetical protein